MRVLIIGGTGLTGTAMTAHLAAQGHEIFLLSRGLTAVDDGGQARRLTADRGDAASFERAYAEAGPDAVIDQISLRGEDVDQVAAFRPARHLVCSSAAVLGSGLGLDEDAPVPAPANPYLSGKLAVEQRASLAGAVILRPAYLYGPGHAPLTVHGREPGLVQRLRAGEPIDVPADGTLALQPTFAADYATAVGAILAVSRPAPLYHIGGPATTWRGWLSALAAAAGVPLRASSVPPDELAATSYWFREYLRHALTIRSARLPPVSFTPLALGARALVGWMDRRLRT